MKKKFLGRSRFWPTLLIASALQAQTPARPAEPQPDSNTVLLDTFTVSANDAAGYRAINSVSGTLIKTPLEKLPISIQVITDELIRDLGVFKIEDAIRYTSGVGLQGRNEGVGTREHYTIRGYSTSLLLRNGVPFNTATDTVSVERIEVVKGPSGVLFGVSDPGGLINYVTKQPMRKRFTRVRQTFASYDAYRTELDLNQPLNSSGTLLFRLPAVYSNEKSWWRFAHWERLYLNPVLAWMPLPDTRVTVEGNYHKQDGIRPRNGTPFRAGFVGLAQPEHLFDGPNHPPFLSPDHSYDGLNRSFTVRVDKTFSDSLAVQAIYEQTDLNSNQFSTLNSGPTQQPNPPYTQREFAIAEYNGSASDTLQLSAVKTIDLSWSKHRMLFGFRRVENRNGSIIYRSRVENPVKNLTNPHPDPAVQFFAQPRATFDPRMTPGLVQGRDYGLVTNNPFNGSPYAWSAFLTNQASFFDERLRLLGGVRYDRIRSVDRIRYTPQAGVNYELRRGFTAYALYSESFRPNGRSDSRDPNSPFFEPEEGKGMELGLKFNALDERLSGTLALFDITRAKVQVTDGSQAVLGGNARSLAGEQKSQGVELDVIYTPTRALSAIFAYAYIDARTTQDKISSLSPDTDGDGVPDSVGMQNEAVAKNSVSLWLRYRVQSGALKNLGLGLGGQWRQGPIYQFPTGNRIFMVQPDDTYRFDATASYKTTLLNRPVDFQVNVQNFTNERYWDRRAQFNAPRIYPEVK